MVMEIVMSKYFKSIFVVAFFALMALPANAVTLNWTLSGVKFDDGGAASGTFSTDSTTGNVLGFNIVTTAGALIPGFT
jgi:hypothetical protein